MFNEKKLGFGLMRLPMNEDKTVNIELLKEMVDLYISQGFTYFDTAWMYCGHQSEKATKEVLTSRYPRDAYTIATKLHGGFFDTLEGRDEIFNTQLENIGVDFFDYYLLHDVGQDHYKKYTRLDCFNWLKEKKEKGLVKYIGFSYHDDAKLLDQVLTEHPEMDFVQLQINYLDWESMGVQSRLCYEVACKHNVPVVVMEPVKGGTLAKVPSSVEDLFKEYHPDMSIPSWAIRFVAGLDNVKMVLSGMSTLEHVQDNTSYMNDFKALDEEEMKRVNQAVELLNSNIAIACTGCEYCVIGCPMDIPIPKYFSLYNADKQEVKEKGWTPQGTYYSRLIENHGKASDCVACYQCEGICPQHLSIVEYLKDVAEYFE